MPTEAYHDAVTALIRLGGGRVWSLVISIFGDLAQGRHDALDGPVLSAILAGMNIKPEATRVALHRLRNDGWIMSEKHGRTSRHSLTEMGRTQSAAASPRIYAKPEDTPRGWQMIVLENATSYTRSEMLRCGFAPLAPRLFIGATSSKPPKDAAVLTGQSVPHWLRAQFEPADLTQDYAALRQVLEQISSTLPDAGALSATQIAVLRCLIVHNWRRIALKHPDLPADLFTDQWQGQRCRSLVHELLERLPRPDLAQIL